VYLPKAPSDYEKYLYITTDRWWLYAFGVLSFISLSVGMVMFSISYWPFYIFLIFTLVSIFYLTASYAIGFFAKDFDLKLHQYLKRKYLLWEPSVDVYLPCCGESLEILENTYRHVKYLEYNNHKVYVLDDAKSDKVKALAEKYNFIYISRDSNELKKAGNLRHAFKRTTGEFIVIFDADFCPRPDFLRETIFYFTDLNVAIVQTPQYFRISDELNWLHKGAAFTQELFYRLIQVNRNHFGGSICVGTNAIYRRKHLEPMGGTAAIGYSEDVHTGFNVVNAGWSLKYIPINLACGVCPDSLSSFFIQQYRWAMGSITLFLNKEFWTSRLSVSQKLCYLTGMLYYITTGLGIILTPIPAILVLAFIPEHIFWFNSVFAIPSFLFGTVIAALWSKQPFGLYGPTSRHIAYCAHLFAFKDKLLNTLVPWEPSGNVKTNDRFKAFKNLLFYWTLLSFFLVVALSFYRMGQGVSPYNFIVLMFFAFYNYCVAMFSFKEQT
jgi:cellulose synthase/poly-beta-1,6-N-acetylglucosamine synthase-like glycosyltransferase